MGTDQGTIQEWLFACHAGYYLAGVCVSAAEDL